MTLKITKPFPKAESIEMIIVQNKFRRVNI